MDTSSTHAAGPVDTPAPPGDERALALKPGMRIRQYELIRELGRGGMGVVYAARDTRLGRRVAIKFLLNAARDVAERFLVEARATAQCGHENIVIIHEVDEHANTPYMVLEFLEGQSLFELIHAAAPFPASRAVELALPIARALARAHAAGIIHRDLKPENVIVTSSGQVKVLDFGIAKALGAADLAHHSTAAVDPDNLQLTRDGTLVGTPPYMAPEQLGTDTIDHRCDLWALGIIMFEMLGGEHPVTPLSTGALLENAVSDEPMRSVRALAHDTPEALAQVVDGCLRKRKGERIPSAAELVRRLERVLPSRSGRALPDGESPYPGLSAFQETDADRFFGRSREIARVIARVRELPLVGVVGPSGVGKSSLVRAGIGPALKDSGERWELVTVRPGRHPIAGLAAAVERFTKYPADELARRLVDEPGLLGTLLRAWSRGSRTHVLVFVDQLEELYTLVGDAAERRAFTAALAGAADDPSAPLRVVVSMRADLLDRVAEDPQFAEELTRGLVLVSAPDADGLRDALEQPARLAGYQFESAAMVGDMLDAVTGAPGALPLLQFTAAKLYDARDRDRRMLTMASYQAIGGVTGALATHADEVVAGMTPPMRLVTAKIFRALVTPERTRAIVELADLEQLGDIRGAIDQLVAARLLIVHPSATVELVHESLIERWPTLRRWLDEDQEDAAQLAQLSAAAKQWEAKGRPAGLVWRGDAADEARRWYAHHPRPLPPRDQAFLDAVFSLAARGKRARRAGLIGAFALLALIAGGASIAFVRVRAAKDEASEREVEARRALAEKEAAMHAREQAEAGRAQEAAGKQRAESEARAKTELVHKSQQELEKTNAELETALVEARAAKERAEQASAKATAAADAAKQATADTKTALDRERARNDQLVREAKTLAKQLK